MKIANMTGHGDVKASSITEVKEYCQKADLKIIKIERQKKFRLHLVAKKE